MHNDTPDEKSLASIFRIIVNARDENVHIHHRDGTISIKRGRLTSTEALRWDHVLGAGLWRQAMPSQRCSVDGTPSRIEAAVAVASAAHVAGELGDEATVAEEQREARDDAALRDDS